MNPEHASTLTLGMNSPSDVEKTLAFLARRAMYMLALPEQADALDESDFMQRGLEMAEELTGALISCIHMVNEDQQSIELVTWSRRTLETYCHATLDRHYPVSEAGIWVEALRQRRPVIFNDYATAEGKRGLPEGHAALQRLISLPVMEKGRVVMLAGVGDKTSDFTDYDIETLQLIANDIWHLVARGRQRKQLADNLREQRALNQKLEAMQGQLLQSEKMASIGQLAAGVAHELNNPIGFVTSNLGSLEAYLADLFAILDAYVVADDAAPQPAFAAARALKQERDFDFLRTDIHQLLAESRDGLGRVAKIVRDLKDFSRAGDAVMQWADLNSGLESTLNIVWNELKYKCTVRKELGDLPEVWCEPSQLNQVFMNLLVNAGHAIDDKGEIVIRTWREGDMACIAVSDSGCGIPPENLKRIFDPFFTTKPIGQGSGLGLSISWSIIERHHGNISVESREGKGTTFTLHLPIKPLDGAFAQSTPQGRLSPASPR